MRLTQHQGRTAGVTRTNVCEIPSLPRIWLFEVGGLKSDANSDLEQQPGHQFPKTEDNAVLYAICDKFNDPSTGASGRRRYALI